MGASQEDCVRKVYYRIWACVRDFGEFLRIRALLWIGCCQKMSNSTIRCLNKSYLEGEEIKVGPKLKSVKQSRHSLAGRGVCLVFLYFGSVHLLSVFRYHYTVVLFLL